MTIGFRGLRSDLRPYAEQALDLARAYGLNVTITSTYRSWVEQKQLRDRYERCVQEGRYPTPGTECAYPANLPGDSAHNWGLAFDSVATWASPESERAWAAYGVTDPMIAWQWVRQALGWQVYDHDRPHAEVPNWRQYAPPDRLTRQGVTASG